MHIELDDLSRSAVHELLQEHLANMYELSPPEQVFALDLSKLKSADITFWTAWEQGLLLGCGALKELSPHHGTHHGGGIRLANIGLVDLQAITEHHYPVAEHEALG